MVHQLIFARPKPGMTEKEFQDYWVNVHARGYASKITQIRRYMVCTRVDYDAADASDPLFSGVAEIWIRPEDQIPSLQSAEFLDGARADEPRWAAFWATLALDTDAHVIVEGPPLTVNPVWIKLYRLLKRREGMPLPLFREFALESLCAGVKALPGLRRYVQGHVRDGFYDVGEARFDAVEQWWFDDLSSLQSALKSPAYVDRIQALDRSAVESKYLFIMAAREHWIIGPQER
jgi:hypothetical protein